jgi:hypothetical protein
MVYTQPYIIKGFIYHPSSYMGYWKKLGKIKRELKDNVVNFARKNFKVPCNVHEVLVLLQDVNHYNVIVMSASHFKHYDTFSRVLMFSNLKCALFFMQKCGHQGKLLMTLEYKRTSSMKSWVWLDGPHQLLDWECGFYVMKLMTKYYDGM